MRQLLYASTATRFCDERDLSTILEQSRHNNAIEGVTGFLWSNGYRFVQLIEGPDGSIDETYRRIARDERHADLTIILDSIVEDRQFGSWSMAHRRSFETASEHDRKVSGLIARVSGAARSNLVAQLGLVDAAPRTSGMSR